MECKFNYPELTWCRSLELIDTLWNVNVKEVCVKELFRLELIDTLWNVNVFNSMMVTNIEI